VQQLDKYIVGQPVGVLEELGRTTACWSALASHGAACACKRYNSLGPDLNAVLAWGMWLGRRTQSVPLQSRCATAGAATCCLTTWQQR
jgi:hypothetical protein